MESNKRDEEVGWESSDLLENEDNQQDPYSVEEEEELDKEAVDGDQYLSQNPSEYSASDSNYHLSWPQTYKQSMDLIASVKPSKGDFLEKISLGTSSTSSSLYKRQNASGIDSSALCEPLLSTTILENKDFPFLTRNSTEKISYHGKLSNQQCSFTQSVLNGINVLCGIGILSVPSAVKGGWLGLVILFVFGVISCYTGILLKRCLDSSPEVQTYPDIGQAAFGKVGCLAVAASCVEYITLMSEDLASVFPNAHLSLCGFHLTSNYVFSIIGALTVLPTVWLQNLSLLSYLSAGGVVASLVVALCLLWVGVVDQVGFHHSGTALELSNLPIAIGLYAVCYTGHSVFPNIYTSMEKPSQFPTVLIVWGLARASWEAIPVPGAGAVKPSIETLKNR
ncbi:Amino acid transporter avt1e [Thalictrum thalictroides]|uniref:Amino acid transporter avt1e n=1 Tax=Thalictrum thalictroides TaxID=46969 RepID=A0A7J6WXU3_THATH|nr:Amino acid transporter avt1e [Thalictrum thalictroides]